MGQIMLSRNTCIINKIKVKLYPKYYTKIIPETTTLPIAQTHNLMIISLTRIFSSLYYVLFCILNTMHELFSIPTINNICTCKAAQHYRIYKNNVRT